MAQQLGYVHDATKADTATFPKRTVNLFSLSKCGTRASILSHFQVVKD